MIFGAIVSILYMIKVKTLVLIKIDHTCLLKYVASWTWVVNFHFEKIDNWNKEESFADSLGCKWWNYNILLYVNIMANLRYVRVPMQSSSVVHVVHEFVPAHVLSHFPITLSYMTTYFAYLSNRQLRMVTIFWARIPTSSEHMSFWYLFSKLHPVTYHSKNMGVRLR